MVHTIHDMKQTYNQKNNGNTGKEYLLLLKIIVLCFDCGSIILQYCLWNISNHLQQLIAYTLAIFSIIWRRIDKTVICNSKVFFHLFASHNHTLRIFPDFCIQKIFLLRQRSVYDCRNFKLFLDIVFFAMKF